MADDQTTTRGSLNIILSMTDGLWKFEVGDVASIFGWSDGFVSPERAFAASLAALENGIMRGGGFETLRGKWVEHASERR